MTTSPANDLYSGTVAQARDWRQTSRMIDQHLSKIEEEEAGGPLVEEIPIE